MMFDASRTQMLEAMGYQLLQRIGRPEPANAVPTAPAPPVPTAASAPVPVERLAAARPLPASVVSDDRLWLAVLAAATFDPAGAEANGLRLSDSGRAVEYVRDELWIDPLALRRDPHAKARLWKALRALRRRALARSP